MKLRWDKWLLGLGSAFIGGGAGAVVSGFTNIAIAPATFNLTSAEGAGKVLFTMLINFVVVGAFSMFFFLKQSPLPTPDDSDPFAFRKKVEAAVAVEKVQEKVRPLPETETKP